MSEYAKLESRLGDFFREPAILIKSVWQKMYSKLRTQFLCFFSIFKDHCLLICEFQSQVYIELQKTA